MNKIELENKITEVLKTVYDPEIPVDIYELGLIYGMDIDDENFVKIRMTLTAPACPIADSMVQEVHDKVAEIEGVKDVFVELVFDPPWDFSKVSEAAKLELGFL
jgi:FeS assembly SUF system protein